MAYTRIEHHPHARGRIRLRHVSAPVVVMALTNPDRVVPGHSGRLIAVLDSLGGGTLRVVFEERAGGDIAYVRTVYRRGGRS